MSTDYVSWNDNLAIGIPEIDDHHKVFFGLLNKLWRGLVVHEAVPTIECVLFDLENYAYDHFHEEEVLMERHGFPGLEAHKESHGEFGVKVKELSSKVAAGETVGLEMLDFLSGWLNFHIRMVDRQYGDFILKKEQAARG